MRTRSCRPMRRGRSRVGVDRLELTSSRIIHHLPRLSAAALAECVGSTACPRHTAVPSSISPPAIRTERDASPGRGGAVWGCPGTHPGSLGVPNARDAPRPKPAACPAPRRTAGPARPHRLRSVRTATRRLGGVGRCGAVVLTHLVRQRPSAKGAHELPRLHMRLELRRHPWHWGTSLLADERSARPPASVERVAHRNGAAASPTGARTTRRAPEAGAPARDGVLLVSLQGVIKRG